MTPQPVQPHAGRGVTKSQERAIVATVCAGKGRVVGMDAICEAAQASKQQVRRALALLLRRSKNNTAPRIVGVKGHGYRFEKEAE